MPPKNSTTKKTVEKQKAKIIEDKTFGLKNKKGAKQQKFIAVVQKQVQNKGAQLTAKSAAEIAEKEKQKAEEKKRKEELQKLFKPIITQTVPKGVDPKSVLCAYFKQGLCEKGNKCKFSHDPAVERKAEKRNIYEDTREQDTMEQWDEAKLDDVINQKHGADNAKKVTQTNIVCKYFLEAVENATYGWFWNCPNGEKCMYRHALPPGFELKGSKNKEDKEEKISMEMLVEKERSALGKKVTPVTLASFLAWKKRKIEEKKEDARKKEDKKQNDLKRGFMNGITGRDLFTYNPDLITNDDEEAGDDIDYKKRADDDEENANDDKIFDIKDGKFEMKEVDGTGSVATEDRFSYLKTSHKEPIKENGTEEEVTPGTSSNKLEIDESLFNVDDLDDIEDELDDLDLEDN